MLKTFSFRSFRTLFAIVLTIALFALPTPIGSPQKASAATPTFGDDNGSVPQDGTMIFHFKANGAYTPLGVLPEPSAFEVTATVGGSSRVIQVASLTLVSGYLLNIIVVSPITAGEVVTVKYTAPTPDVSPTNKALQDTSGNDASSFGPLTVATNSSLVSALPTPAAPTVIAGEESVTASITAPTSGGQPARYRVYASPGNGRCDITGASGSCIISNLTAGAAYTFTVIAFDNINGATARGPASASVTALAKVIVPNTPGTPTVVAGEESATITVTAPTTGLTPTSYEVTASPGGANCTVSGASGSCTINGLTAGTAYTFTTIAKISTGDSSASTASAATTVLAKTTATTVPVSTTVPTITTTIPAGYTPSWDKEPLTDSETDANTVGFFPAISPGVIIITDEMGFTLDKKNGIKPKIRMKNYAGKIKMTISATYKVGAKSKKYKCTFAPFGTAKKIKTAKWRWYTPKKACILPAPLVAAVRANTATLSASGKWSRQWLTTAKKTRPDKTKIKPRTLKYTMKAKPAAVK